MSRRSWKPSCLILRGYRSAAGLAVALLASPIAPTQLPTVVLAADFEFRDRLPVSVDPGDNPYREYRQLATGPLPHDIAIGDIDGDGIHDLVVAGRRHDDIRIFLGDGHGGWRTGAQLFLDGPPGALLLADLDGDSHLDVLATDYARSRLYRWRNTGDGTFEEARRLVTGIYPAAIVAADFNGDGRLDVATAEYDVTRGSATIFLAGEGGSLTHRLTLDLGLHAIDLATGDIDADGRADLAVACSGADRIIVLYGAGDGTFERRLQLLTAHEPYAVTLLDVNRDGLLDVAAACEGEDQVSWFAGRPARQFGERVDIPVGRQPWALVAADWNEDGRSDLIVANRASHSMTLLEANLDGELEEVDEMPGGDLPSRLALGDVDGDHRPDLISMCEGEGGVRFFRNSSAGTSIRNLKSDFDDGSVHLQWSVAAGRERDVSFGIHRRGNGGAWEEVSVTRLVELSDYRFIDSWPPFDDPEYRLDEYEFGQLVRSVGPIRIPAPYGDRPDMEVVGANPVRGPMEFRALLTAPGDVRLGLFDIQGRRLLAIVDSSLPAGRHRWTWDGRGEGGVRLASGIYFARIEAPGLVRSIRLVLGH